jgi:hypothetical protein
LNARTRVGKTAPALRAPLLPCCCYLLEVDMRDVGRPVALVALLLVAPVVMAMGGFGGGRESEAPARDYRATFTDPDGMRIEDGRVTAGGDTSLEGDLGRGRLRIPFDNVSRVTFRASGTERDRVLADVQLREGEPLTLTMRSSTTFYGRVPSGAYQIRARDLRSVEFAR